MRFRGEVEQARRELRALGHTPTQARKLAPRFAADRLAAQDAQVKPYPWLGTRAATANGAFG